MKKILIVDDEVKILKSMERLFMDTNYDIITAENGEEALNKLKDKEIDLIITDMRMPEMDGLELLKRVKLLYPKVIRIVLSGFSDEKLVFKSLNENIAKLYIFKPWNNEELLTIIENIFKTEEILKGNNLYSFINNMDSLPTIKTNYQRILDLIEKDSDISILSSEIERDISISTQILHIANSAYFGVKTSSIKQAINFIGLNNTKNLVVTTSIIDLIDDSNNLDGDIQNIWKHAFLGNKLLSFIYEKNLHKKLPEFYSSAGLLMNIGVVFMLKFHKEKYLKLIMEARQGRNVLQLEKEYFNVSHAEAGGYLLEWWEIPFPIVETALYHHTPLDDKVINKELLCIAHIVMKYSMELLGKKWTGEFDENVFTYLGIDKIKFQDSLKEFKI